MEPITLRYFREVAEQGSVRQAAERLFVAQSAVSRQVALLEEELGVSLFERRSRGMVLTDAGRLLLDYSHDTRSRFEELRDTIQEYGSLSRGHVGIATVEGLIDSFLPDVINEFGLEFPGISLDVVALGSHAVAEAVAERQYDLGIVFGRAPGGDLIEIACMRQPLCLLVAPAHPLARQSRCTLEDLATFPLILPGRIFGIRQLVDRIAARKKLRLKVTVETNTLAFAKRLVKKSGDHVTILPVDFVMDDVRAGSVVAVPIAEPELDNSDVSLVATGMRKLSPAARRLAERIDAQMKRHVLPDALACVPHAA